MRLFSSSPDPNEVIGCDNPNCNNREPRRVMESLKGGLAHVCSSPCREQWRKKVVYREGN